ncbi:jg19937 [Pararge aegeria aegeria]|uniref:Jg19937 protein n=1 Tax=Pararge aegeria aegeria TaxID=348720 RepID=A0A8S4RVQ9_9NEOP|nr:jg19937 [Pararge aegeria aegeria]
MMQPGVQFVINNCGKEIAILDHYAFGRDLRSVNASIWRCTRGARCKARFKLTPDGLSRIISEHNHERPKCFVSKGLYFTKYNSDRSPNANEKMHGTWKDMFLGDFHKVTIDNGSADEETKQSLLSPANNLMEDSDGPPDPISSPLSKLTSSSIDDQRTPYLLKAKNDSAESGDEFCLTNHCVDYSPYPSGNSVTSSGQSSPTPDIRSSGQKRFDTWADNKRKRLKNEGKVYLSKRGHIVPAKVIGNPCNCKYNCSTKLTPEERMDIFEKFWKLGDREKQWLHVASYSSKERKKKDSQKDMKRNRQFTYKYYLPKDLTRVEVCKTMFLNTYAVSERVVRTAWAKYDGRNVVERDMRGRRKNLKPKT